MKRVLACYSLFFLFSLSIHAQGLISTVAGNGLVGSSGDGALAINAKLNNPASICLDDTGNIYIADEYNNKIRKVSASTGKIITIAGTGTTGFSGDSALAINAQLYYPIGICLDQAGNIYIADCLNNRIRKITVSTGIITTVAGNNFSSYSGDGVLATATSLYHPSGVCVDVSGNIFIADYANNRIRKVTKATGLISTIAGTGTAGYFGDGGLATSSKLCLPNGVAVDGYGNIYIADLGNYRVRKIDATTGNINTIIGNGSYGFSGDGGPATSAELNGPENISLDAYGNVFVADISNNRIRKYTVADGNINTIAGNGTAGFSADGVLASSSELFGPTGTFVDASGNVFIADQNNNRIRKITAHTGVHNISFSNIGSVSPNPSSGIYNIHINNNTTYHISVFNISGEVVYKTESSSDNFSIDISTQADGMYFLSILCGEETYVQKLLLVH